MSIIQSSPHSCLHSAAISKAATETRHAEQLRSAMQGQLVEASDGQRDEAEGRAEKSVGKLDAAVAKSLQDTNDVDHKKEKRDAGFDEL